MVIFKELEKLAREINNREGYQEISTPILVKREVFEKEVTKQILEAKNKRD